MADEKKDGGRTAVDFLAFARAQGGLAINNVLSGDTLKPFAHAAGLVIGACMLISMGSAIGVAWTASSILSESKAAIQRADDRAQQRAEADAEAIHEANVNLRWAWYWLDTDYAQQLANGGHPPPLPKRPAFVKK